MSVSAITAAPGAFIFSLSHRVSEDLAIRTEEAAISEGCTSRWSRIFTSQPFSQSTQSLNGATSTSIIIIHYQKEERT